MHGRPAGNGPRATLALFPVDKPGTEQLTIQVRIDEQYATVPAYTDLTWAQARPLRRA